MKKLLLKCLLENIPSDIIYMDHQGRITKRTIFIKKIEENKMKAFCTLRERNRIFVIQNILAAEKGSVHFENQKRHSRSQSNVGVKPHDASTARRGTAFLS